MEGGVSDDALEQRRRELHAAGDLNGLFETCATIIKACIRDHATGFKPEDREDLHGEMNELVRFTLLARWDPSEGNLRTYLQEWLKGAITRMHGRLGRFQRLPQTILSDPAKVLKAAHKLERKTGNFGASLYGAAAVDDDDIAPGKQPEKLSRQEGLNAKGFGDADDRDVDTSRVFWEDRLTYGRGLRDGMDDPARENENAQRRAQREAMRAQLQAWADPEQFLAWDLRQGLLKLPERQARFKELTGVHRGGKIMDRMAAKVGLLIVTRKDELMQAARAAVVLPEHFSVRHDFADAPVPPRDETAAYAQQRALGAMPASAPNQWESRDVGTVRESFESWAARNRPLEFSDEWRRVHEVYMELFADAEPLAHVHVPKPPKARARKKRMEMPASPRPPAQTLAEYNAKKR
jgi:hypothetical protein